MRRLFDLDGKCRRYTLGVSHIVKMILMLCAPTNEWNPKIDHYFGNLYVIWVFIIVCAK